MDKMRIIFTIIIFCLTFGCFAAISTAGAASSATAPSRDDSAYIQGLIDKAAVGADGIKVVVIPSVNPNDPSGSNVYQLSHAIELPSNTTVKLDNCTLRLNDGTLCNIFISKGCYNATMSADEELTNISIIGIGNAVLDGGNHNGVTERTSTVQNGFSTINYNTSIKFRNVNGFTLRDVTVKEPRHWGMTFIYCRNGVISDINFDCSNKAPNQDGIDLRVGCNNIDISNITGVTGDDTVALTALSLDPGFDIEFKVDGKDNHIHHVNITNVKAACNGGHGIIRLLCHHGNKLYNVHIENIEDMGTNHVQGVLRIGDNGYTGTGAAMKYGELYNVTINGVISNGKYAIYAPNTNVTTNHVSYQNVVVKYAGGQLTNLTKDTPIQPLTLLEGDEIYSFEGGDIWSWICNNKDVRTADGTWNGAPSTFTMWPIGANRPGGGKALEIYNTIQNDTTEYDSVQLQLIMAHYAGNDPAVEKMKIYYSTDKGQSWSSSPIQCTMAFHGAQWKTLDGNIYNVWSFTGENLADLTDQPITNIMVRPYGEDGTLTRGAFRMLSLRIVGNNTPAQETTVPDTSADQPIDTSIDHPTDQPDDQPIDNTSKSSEKPFLLIALAIALAEFIILLVKHKQKK